MAHFLLQLAEIEGLRGDILVDRDVLEERKGSELDLVDQVELAVPNTDRFIFPAGDNHKPGHFVQFDHIDDLVMGFFLHG